MRFLTFILCLFMFNTIAFAGYTPDCNGSKTGYYRYKSDCEIKTGTTCYSYKRAVNCEYDVLIDEEVDDFTKPNWGTRSMVEACAGEDDCKAKALAKECTDKRVAYYNAEYSEVWCNKILSYQKKLSGRKIIAEDETKKAAYDANKTAKKADQAAMAIASKALGCGKKVISRMLLQNKPKNLSKAQVRNLVKTYKDIKNLLETGSLESAREDILAVAINEPIVTQADKDALIAELDSCKP